MAVAGLAVVVSSKVLEEFKEHPNTHKIMLLVRKSRNFIKYHSLQVVATWVAAVDLANKVEAAVDLAKAAVDLAKVEAAVDLVKAVVDSAKAVVDSARVVADSAKAAVDLAKVAVDLVKVAVAVDLVKVAVVVVLAAKRLA